MMKTPLVCLLVLWSALAVAQQEDSTAKAWQFSVVVGLNLSHTLNVNPRPGAGKDGFSTTDAVDFTANFVKGPFMASNEAHWQFSLYKTEGKPIRSAADALNTLHDFSLAITPLRILNFNLIARASTSVFTVYEGNYLKDLSGNKAIQKILSPYDVTLSPGLKFQPTKHFRVSMSPYSFRLYGVYHNYIAKKGIHIEETNPDGSYKNHIMQPEGAELNVWYDRKIKKFMTMQYRLSVKTNYFEGILDNGGAEGLFITKIKLVKNVYLTHRATLKADLAERPFKPWYAQVVTISYAVTF